MCINMDDKEPCFDEVVLSGTACPLYFDIEIKREDNRPDYIATKMLLQLKGIFNIGDVTESDIYASQLMKQFTDALMLTYNGIVSSNLMKKCVLPDAL